MVALNPPACNFGCPAADFDLPGIDGRLDGPGRNPAPPDARRELLEAMLEMARTGARPRQQMPSIACSSKWHP